MRWNYTKTAFIASAMSAILRLLICTLRGEDPWNTLSAGGGMFGALDVLLIMLPILFIADLVGMYLVRRSRVGSASRTR